MLRTAVAGSPTWGRRMTSGAARTSGCTAARHALSGLLGGVAPCLTAHLSGNGRAGV